MALAKLAVVLQQNAHEADESSKLEIEIYCFVRGDPPIVKKNEVELVWKKENISFSEANLQRRW